MDEIRKLKKGIGFFEDLLGANLTFKRISSYFEFSTDFYLIGLIHQIGSQFIKFIHSVRSEFTIFNHFT